MSARLRSRLARVPAVLLELGPVAQQDVASWTRLARRLVTELRVCPGELEGIVTEDFLGSWSNFIEEIDQRRTASPADYRWSHEVDDDQAEFLLHGMTKCLCADSLGPMLTEAEVANHAQFTLHLAASLVEGLMEQGRDCEHYAHRISAAISQQRSVDRATHTARGMPGALPHT